ncbi:hypothetical protein RhiirA5_497913 [Rhizophagus irregularis]|uniref:RNI-like protein n=1 Tax=Rhizophagus irregularis TaxID=588596 RepID=A0A2N0PWF0_9GLOM|nr:hypothetical protein RhiirA5_497913 [Rhizophagus irregularis]
MIEETLQLKNQLEPNQIDNINLDEEYKPLFEYPKYMEKYNYFIINSVINSCFVRYFSNLSTSHNKIYYIIPIFHQSILRQSKNIKQLDISLYLFYRKWFKNFNVQNFTSNLTRLNSLSLNFYLNGTVNNKIEQEFLSNIANICLNLRELIIKLPQIQRYIRNCYSLLNNILLSLEFQKSSLVQLEFTNTNFSNVSLKNFRNLYNLKYLRFEKCEGILLDQCEVLNIVSFKLTKLSLKRNNWGVDVTSLMIKYLGTSLQSLLVDNPTIPLIENMLIFCSNLIFFKIRIYYHLDLTVLPFFKDLNSIRILSINVISYNSEFFINLANNIPINISEISIYIYFRNSNKFLRFKEFLENCHNGFKIINLNHIIELEFLKIVLNYIKRSNGTLKIFGMLGLDKELNDEELKLLDQIKDKGVKIVDSYSFQSYY